MKQSAAFWLSALAFSCAMAQSPESSGAATITFVNHTQDGRTTPYIFEGAEECTKRRVLGMREGPAEWESVPIPAGQSVSMAVYWEEWNKNPSNRCTLTWTFLPEEGKQYKARFDISGNRCFIDLRDVTEGEAGAAKVRLAMRRYRAPWSDGWCHPD